MMILAAVVVVVISCTVRKPLERGSIVAQFAHLPKPQLLEALTGALRAEGISVVRTDVGKGTIVTDSFEVDPQDCDCGMNFFGAEYPGSRRGQMRIDVTTGRDVTVKFDFHTLLTITANNKQVRCTSFGRLEERLLKSVETKLGIARLNAAP